MAWEILWALILGFGLSAVIQAVVSKEEMSRLLPDDSPRTIALACALGAASSSCSYAAVALARCVARSHKVIGQIATSASRTARLWLVALLAAAVGHSIKCMLPFHRPRLVGPCVLLPYAALYLAVTYWMGIASMGAFSRFFLRRRQVALFHCRIVFPVYASRPFPG
jgi:hypothetical protein